MKVKQFMSADNIKQMELIEDAEEKWGSIK